MGRAGRLLPPLLRDAQGAAAPSRLRELLARVGGDAAAAAVDQRARRAAGRGDEAPGRGPAADGGAGQPHRRHRALRPARAPGRDPLPHPGGRGGRRRADARRSTRRSSRPGSPAPSSRCSAPAATSRPCWSPRNTTRRWAASCATSSARDRGPPDPSRLGRGPSPRRSRRAASRRGAGHREDRTDRAAVAAVGRDGRAQPRRPSAKGCASWAGSRGRPSRSRAASRTASPSGSRSWRRSSSGSAWT